MVEELRDPSFRRPQKVRSLVSLFGIAAFIPKADSMLDGPRNLAFQRPCSTTCFQSPAVLLKTARHRNIALYYIAEYLFVLPKNFCDIFFAQDIEPGSCIRPQLAHRSNSPEDALQRMGGKPFTIEFKFDGERMQVSHQHWGFMFRPAMVSMYTPLVCAPP